MVSLKTNSYLVKNILEEKYYLLEAATGLKHGGDSGVCTAVIDHRVSHPININMVTSRDKLWLLLLPFQLRVNEVRFEAVTVSKD